VHIDGDDVGAGPAPSVRHREVDGHCARSGHPARGGQRTCLKRGVRKAATTSGSRLESPIDLPECVVRASQ
jgi:hypothetical protein